MPRSLDSRLERLEQDHERELRARCGTPEFVQRVRNALGYDGEDPDMVTRRDRVLAIFRRAALRVVGTCPDPATVATARRFLTSTEDVPS